jgi:hypothetical protein
MHIIKVKLNWLIAMVILALSCYANAQSNTQKSHIDQLLSTLRTETTDLNILKAACFELQKIASSTPKDDEIKKYIQAEAMTVWAAAAESLHSFRMSFLTHYSPDENFKADRFGADVLIFLYGNMAQHVSGLNLVIGYDLFEIFSSNNKLAQRALLMWLDEYFIGGASAAFYLFPPEPTTFELLTAPGNGDTFMHDTPGWYQMQYLHLGFMMMSPIGKLLAHVKFMSRYDESASADIKELQSYAKQVWAKINRELLAAKSPPAGPVSDGIKLELRKMRFDLATRWLEEVEEITKDWNEQILSAPANTVKSPKTLTETVERVYQAARGLRGYPALPSCNRFLDPSTSSLQ